ncbi:sigma-54 interaction domain-containing protein [Modicisalibacter luteus]|uniref:HTH-type transcriptional regulatory protein TyrR n=1 Tax=Modicisalibacter luteus TaxID=453962 RepID=A0ABV7M4N7_9GAMM|nr:sigma 54-interacting transcriptional regulator [Halomonas lutea]GHA88044.1 RNA polymerase subunit sigma-54 [Halomonas lutea]
MEQPRLAARLLEGLPLGVILIQPGETLYINPAARSSLGAAPTTYAELCQREPLLCRLADPSQAADHGSYCIGNEPHFVRSVRLFDNACALLLLPMSLLEGIQPELNRLKQSFRDFQEIFRNSFDGIFVADGEGNTLMVNEGSERNYDLKAEEMVGKNVAEFEKKGLIKPVIAGRVVAERQRITAVQRTHTGKTIMVTGIPLFNDEGKVRRVIINSRDTTELLKLQEELARAQDNLRRMETEVCELRRANLKFEGIVLNSPNMQRIATLAARVAKVDTTILITGESGVGKEVVAKLIHRESSRSRGPFIKINCGAIPRDLLESELFGYESGAFTGAHRQGKVGLIETANGGTLFLDEIGELPLELQVKMLQVLQDHSFSRVGGTRTIEVDLRIIAATNVDLETMVEQKRFRNDLYYRLNIVPINIPPLKERREDIFPLVQRYLDDFNAQYGLSKRLSERALQCLLTYGWPGNVRELRNIIERLVVTSPYELIATDDLPKQLRPGPNPLEKPEMDFKTRVARFEAGLVREAVEKYGTTRAAASHLSISQATAVRKLKADPALVREILEPND